MSTNLTKREIVLEIYEKTGFPQKQIQDTVQMTLDIVMDALAAGRNVELRNFGVFEVKRRAARKARNPRTGEKVFVPEKFVVTFKPGKEMEERVRELERRANEAARLQAMQNSHAAVPPPAPPTHETFGSATSYEPDSGSSA